MWLDEVNFFSLLILMVACCVATEPIDRMHRTFYTYLLSAGLMLAYFLRCFLKETDHAWYVFVSFWRAGMGYLILQSFFTVLFATQHRIAILHDQYLEEVRIRRVIADQRRAEVAIDARVPYVEPQPEPVTEPEPQPEVPPPPDPPIPRSERLKAASAEAQEAYEQEVEVLKTMPLDKDERCVLEQRAKQRLIVRIRTLSEEA